MTKICSSCGIEKDDSLFHKKSKSSDGLQSRCKECNKEQRKNYYRSADGRNKNSLAGARYTVQMRSKVYDYLLENPCIDCGESDPVVLEFDHRNGVNKVDCISRLVNNSGWEKIYAEILKCDVRCANCHKKRTAKQFNWLKLEWSSGD